MLQPVQHSIAKMARVNQSPQHVMKAREICTAHLRAMLLPGMRTCIPLWSSPTVIIKVCHTARCRVIRAAPGACSALSSTTAQPAETSKTKNTHSKPFAQARTSLRWERAPGSMCLVWRVGFFSSTLSARCSWTWCAHIGFAPSHTQGQPKKKTVCTGWFQKQRGQQPLRATSKCARQVWDQLFIPQRPSQATRLDTSLLCVRQEF
jgi:hypothetical protein